MSPQGQAEKSKMDSRMTPEWKKEFWASLALRHTPGIGPRTWKRLLVHYQSPYAAVVDARSWRRRKLVAESQAEAYLSESWREKALKEWSLVRGCGYSILLWNDERYPERLRQIPDPPMLLYYMGDASLFANPGVAVVGSRGATKHGRESSMELARRLSKAGVTVISGLAWGIDRQAHLGGLQGAGSTIAVLGTGLDMIYPADNRDVWLKILEQGLIVSEFGPGAHPDPKNFPRRNRIISGLSMGVVVAEAPAKSGALITARHALETGREVFAMPGIEGAPSYAGCRHLLDEGATAVQNADDVLMAITPLLAAELVRVQGAIQKKDIGTFLSQDHIVQMNERSEPAPKEIASGQGAGRVAEISSRLNTASRVNLSGEEDALYQELPPGQKVHIDTLSRCLGWETGKVSRMLVHLELRGLVKQWPGMNYSTA